MLWSDQVSNESRCRLAVLISGGGTTLKNLLQKVQSGELANVEIARVISSSEKAGGLEFAKNANVPCQVVRSGRPTDAESFSHEIFQPLRDEKIDLVIMAGFLKHVLIPEDFEGRVLNIHPSLIPAFCGQGYYGQRVHAAVLEHGVKVSGCTVHFVDNEYDHGPIVLQRAIEVAEDDTPSSLAARIFEEECQAYPEAIRLFAQGRLSINGSRVIVSQSK
ncbi:MAG: phosphoribosylglycinamide formyltransferase [Planctomycetaceae bacterium]|nr:phosphoribosylglycinamide formyltransferase [Planctomycetaceae bacterium]